MPVRITDDCPPSPFRIAGLRHHPKTETTQFRHELVDIRNAEAQSRIRGEFLPGRVDLEDKSFTLTCQVNRSRTVLMLCEDQSNPLVETSRNLQIRRPNDDEVQTRF
jgi:hypothetical protein